MHKANTKFVKSRYREYIKQLIRRDYIKLYGFHKVAELTRDIVISFNQTMGADTDMAYCISTVLREKVEVHILETKITLSTLQKKLSNTMTTLTRLFRLARLLTTHLTI